MFFAAGTCSGIYQVKFCRLFAEKVTSVGKHADWIPAGAVEGVGKRACHRTRFADTVVPIASAPSSVNGDARGT